MERKIGIYKDALRKSGNPVSAIEWIKKKEWKRGTRGYTTHVTGSLKLDFIREVPKEVFLGRIRYEVRDYVADTIQCWNCQKLGHISKNCKSQPVCVFCGTKGHRKGDNRCGNRRVCCANCKESHPSSYRGCIAFLREKEAHRIRAKEKTPLYNARKLASVKEFPHLNRVRREQEAIDNNTEDFVREPGVPRDSSGPSNFRDSSSFRDPSGSRDTVRRYAGAVTAGQPTQPANPPQQTPVASAWTIQPEDTHTGSQRAAAQIVSQACHSCTCSGEGVSIERKLNKILKKNITKLLRSVTQVITDFALAQIQGNTLNDKEKLDFIANRISQTLDNDMCSSSDNSDHQSSSEENEEPPEEEESTADQHPGNDPTTRYIPAKERNRMKRKKKKKCL